MTGQEYTELYAVFCNGFNDFIVEYLNAILLFLFSMNMKASDTIS